MLWLNEMYRYAIAVVFAFDLWDLAAAKNDCRPKDCYDLKCYNVSKAKDGPHTIYPDAPDLPSLPVSCDQETDGGGWIMSLRRLDGTVNFTRNWDAYKRGFGQNGGSMTELWLGNENVYQLLQSNGTTEWELRIEVDAFDETTRSIVSSNFRMLSESIKYKIVWDGDGGHSPVIQGDWNFHMDVFFRTIDRVEQECIGELDQYRGGWWYRYGECTRLFLTGEYVNKTEKTYKSIAVNNFKHGYSLKRARMMLRPTNGNRSCNNPCKNGGTCEHVADPIGHRCACTSESCGATCEVVNPCKNSGTCEVDAITKIATCKCDAEFTGLTCEYMIREDTPGEDTTGENTTGDDTTRDNTTGDDTTGDNTTRDNTTGDDTTRDNTTGDNTTGDDTTRDNTTRDNTTGDYTTRDNTTGDNTTGDDTTGDNTTRDNTTGNDTTRDNTTGDNTTGDDTTRDNTTGDDTTGDGTTGDDTTRDNTTGDNTTGDDTTGDDTTRDNTTREDTTGEDSTYDDTTGDNTTGDDTTGDDTTGDNTTGDDTSRDNTTDEDATRHNTTRDNTTGEETPNEDILREDMTDTGLRGHGSPADTTTPIIWFIWILMLRLATNPFRLTT